MRAIRVGASKRSADGRVGTEIGPAHGKYGRDFITTNRRAELLVLFLIIAVTSVATAASDAVVIAVTAVVIAVTAVVAAAFEAVVTAALLLILLL